MSALTVETYEGGVARSGHEDHDRGDQRPSSRAVLHAVRQGERRGNPAAPTGPERRGHLRVVADVQVRPSVAQRERVHSQSTLFMYESQILRLIREDALVRTLVAVFLVVSISAMMAGIGYAFFLSPSEVITVGAGDSLWSIASSVSEDGNVAETVSQIQNLNHLSGDTIYAGQELVIPAH